MTWTEVVDHTHRIIPDNNETHENKLLYYYRIHKIVDISRHPDNKVALFTTRCCTPRGKLITWWSKNSNNIFVKFNHGSYNG